MTSANDCISYLKAKGMLEEEREMFKQSFFFCDLYMVLTHGRGEGVKEGCISKSNKTFL